MVRIESPSVKRAHSDIEHTGLNSAMYVQCTVQVYNVQCTTVQCTYMGGRLMYSEAVGTLVEIEVT